MHRSLVTVSFSLLSASALAQTAGAPSGGASTSVPATAAPASPVPGRQPQQPAPNPSAPLGPTCRCLRGCCKRRQPSGAATTAPDATRSQGAPTAPDPNLPATASGGRAQPGGASASEQRTRTGKNAITKRYADCAKLWDSHTHMSKADGRAPVAVSKIDCRIFKSKTSTSTRWGPSRAQRERKTPGRNG